MSLEKIIKKAKGQKKEMSAISFNITLELKQQLISIAKENDITVNAFLVTMIDNVLNGELRENDNLKIVEKLEELLKKEQELLKEEKQLGKQEKREFAEAIDMDVDELSKKEINQLNKSYGIFLEKKDSVQKELEDARHMIRLLTRS